MNNILQIAQSLKSLYLPKNIDFSWNSSKKSFLIKSIIPSDITVLSGEGEILQTNRGKLIDLASMTVNCILGQNDPWINANLVAYLLSGRPSFLTSKLGSEYYYKVAKRICSVTKIKNAVIDHRQCNGTDVTELAILAAYNHRCKGQQILASFKNSYHGQGLTAYLSSGLQKQHQFLINESPVIFFDYPTNTNNIYNTTMTNKDQVTLNSIYQNRKKIFAIIIEPIQVNNSVNTPSIIFMKKLKEICEKNVISLIFDEVQTGFGWLGTMTAAELFGVQPNLMALSKALTSGNGPFSALVCEKKYQDIKDGTGAKTNGADIRSLIASNSVMDRLLGISKDRIPNTVDEKLYEELKKGLLTQFPQKQLSLHSRLVELQNKTKGIIKNIKGYGLIKGIEIINSKGKYDDDLTAHIQHNLLDNGVLVRHYKHTLIIKPPIVTKEHSFDKSFSILEKTFKKFI